MLAVDDEPSLSGIEECLKAAGVEHVAIREPDPPWFGALTAIGMLTDDRKKLKSVVGKLPLLGAA